MLNIDKLRTTSYKPSTNAACERFHRTLNSLMGKVTDNHKQDWDLVVPHVLSAYRSTQHDSTGYTPNYLMYGRQVNAPVDIILGEKPQEQYEDFDAYVDQLQDRLYNAYEITRQALRKNADANKRKYDVRVRPTPYKVGDKVMVFNPRHLSGVQNKWSRKYQGPFTVTKLLGPVDLIVKRPHGQKEIKTHVDKVKPYVDANASEESIEEVEEDESPSPTPSPPSSPELDSGIASDAEREMTPIQNEEFDDSPDEIDTPDTPDAPDTPMTLETPKRRKPIRLSLIHISEPTRPY